MSFSRLVTYAKGITAIGALLAGVGAAYAAFGLPIPATTAIVDAKLAPLYESIRGLKILVVGQSLDQLAMSRAFLRAERASLEQAILTATIESRPSMNRRLGEISDQLAEIDRKDAELRKRQEELTGKVL